MLLMFSVAHNVHFVLGLMSLLYQGAHGGVEALWMLGAGVSWRAMGQPMWLL